MKLPNPSLLLATCLVLCLSCSPETSTSQTTQPEAKTTDTTNTTAGKTIILTIDGGGIKGVIPATILAQLESDLGRPVYTMFDVIGGTSTGGIISIGLTTPQNTGKPSTAQEVQDIYLNNCNDLLVENSIFPDGAQYFANSQGKGIEAFMQSFLGNVTLGSAYYNTSKLPNARVRQVFTLCYIVNSDGGKQTTATPGENYGPYLFNWVDARTDASQNYYAWEAARGTSAAPIFFPIAHVGGGTSPRSGAAEKWVIDGGVAANNPVIFGLEQGARVTQSSDFNNFIVVSIGCGINPFNGGVGVTNEEASILPDRQEYGFWGASWVTADLYNLAEVEAGRGRIVELLMDANQFSTDSYMEQMQKIFPGMTYIRLQPDLTGNETSTFDCNNVAALDSIAQSYILGGAGTLQYRQLVQLLQQQ